MSVNYLYPGIVLHAPAPVLRRAAECNLLVVKEKILVHSTQLGHHPRVYQHASSGDPSDRPCLNSPTSLVFPTGARYELLGDRSPEAGERSPSSSYRAPVGNTRLVGEFRQGRSLGSPELACW